MLSCTRKSYQHFTTWAIKKQTILEKKVLIQTFSQGMDAQLHCREVSLADLSTELIKPNPPTEHQVPDYPLVVRHVIDDPFDGSLLDSFCLGELWNDTGGSRSQGRC